MTDFTTDDLNVLMEAMEAWEVKDASGELLGDLVGAMLFREDETEARAKYEADKAVRRETVELERRNRKERSILIRAKLVQMLDAKRAADFYAHPSVEEAS